MNERVMARAEGCQIREVCRAPSLPVVEVMHVTPFERCVTTIDRTTAELREQGETLGGGREPSLAAQVEDHAITVEHSGNDAAFAGQLSCGLDSDHPPAVNQRIAIA